MLRKRFLSIAAADQLNDRPRKTLGLLSPAQSLSRVLSGQTPVATTH
jgi:hypothetical protein